MKYYLLGPLELVTSAGLTPIRGKRVRALLAILLMYRGQVVPIERIVDDIWLDNPPRSAVENVRTYIYQLRALLGHRDGEQVLESQPGGYRLVVGPEELDVTRFLRLSNEGRRAHRLGQHDTAAVLLGEALGYWRGTPLSGIDLSQAMKAKTVALKEHWWQTQLDWMSARLALGETSELVASLRELIGERPLDESLWSLLVTALALSGRTGEALAAFDEARRIFVDELGIEPGPELRRLQARVLRGDEEFDPPRRGSGARHLGGDPAPHQLPSDIPAFVGRDEALRGIRALAEQAAAGVLEHVPTVLISGPPGVGKTATAVAAAKRIHARVPDGELYADLGGLTGRPLDPDDVITTLLGAFGIAQEAVPDGADERRSLYRSLLSERRMVVLLDNAADPKQVLPLIPGPGRSLVIVASRRRLSGVQADLRLTLDPLSVAEALEMLGNTIGPGRVASEPVAARQIIEACGRLPCAIEIAGARLCARPDHPLQVLADRLGPGDRVLDELTFDGSSLRDAFESSYEALNLRARRCFRALGLFSADSITAAAVGQAIQLPPTITDRELEGLVSEGLLSTGGTIKGIPAFRMLPVMHLYARERLELEALHHHPESA